LKWLGAMLFGVFGILVCANGLWQGTPMRGGPIMVWFVPSCRWRSSWAAQ
jgi:hypothetical protein